MRSCRLPAACSSPADPVPTFRSTAAAKDLIQRLLVVEPSKRYSADQVLAHPWVAATDGSGAHDISRALLEMKKFNAKRKFRAGIRVAKVISTLQASAKVRSAVFRDIFLGPRWRPPMRLLVLTRCMTARCVACS